MADETDAERAARLELECEELTEQLHFQKSIIDKFTRDAMDILQKMKRNG